MNALNPTRAELLTTFGLDLTMAKGSGCRLTDDAGREYLDFLAQYGALPFGHNPPEIWAALRRAESCQAPAMLQPLRSLPAERLAVRLAEITPGDLGIVTFANSGAETVEAAIKLARVRTGRDRVVSTLKGFHGKTLGALSATGNPLYQIDFAAPAPGFDYVPYGDLSALRAHFETDAGKIAAFIVEPIQGEGGVTCPPDGYIDRVIALCREFGVLSILDEIQTGFGRTGKLFACSDCAEPPDMLLLAKALGGGLVPIGACVVRPSAWDDRFGRLHSSTFAGNGLACAAALATIDLLLENNAALIARVCENGLHLRAGLETLQAIYPEVIREVRGRGYMMGIEFQRFDLRDDSAAMAFASLNGGATALISSYLMNVEKVLTAPLFNDSHVLRLQPPLVAGRSEIEHALAALGAVCAVLSRRDTRTLVSHLIARNCPQPASPALACEVTPSRRRQSASRPGSFAFLIHYTEPEDILRSDPSFSGFSPRELTEWQAWVKRLGAGFARRIPEVVSHTGETAEGWIMSVPMLPQDMRGRGRQLANSMIRDAVDLAAQDGIGRVGLGAFTSIVTRGGAAVTGRGPAITSGNTLTAVAAVESIENVARRTGIALGEAHVVVVGASGAIGRLAALMLARRAGRMTLVGNAANPFASRLLTRVAVEVRDTLAARPANPEAISGDLHRRIRFEGEQPRRVGASTPGVSSADILLPALAWTTDLRSALHEADIVLVATNSEATVVDPCDLAPGTLVCDVARPPNVAHANAARAGVLVFDGGLVTPPSPIDLGPFRTLPPDLCWGCLAETMLLALAREEADFSIGSCLPLDDADHVAWLARRHGFRPAEPQWYGHRLSATDFDRFARQVAEIRQSAGAQNHRRPTAENSSGVH